MNKILRNSVLSLVTIFSLASCDAPQVEPEVAKQRAQAIIAEQNKEEFSSPKTFTVNAKTEFSLSANAQGEELEQVIKMEQKIVVDLEKGYYYESMTADGVDQSIWVYLEEEKVIAAVDAPELGKIYSEIPSANLEVFAISVSPYVESVYDIILDQQWLDLDNLVKNITATASLANPVFDGKTTYTSSEEGNLGVSISGDLTGGLALEEGAASIPATANIKTNISFDNYLMQSYKINVDIEAGVTAPGGTLNVKVGLNQSLSVNYGSASISKPNLKNFTLQAQ